TDPAPMLDWLRQSGRLSERKARLYVVACCHRIAHLIPVEPSRQVIVVAEHFADGLADRTALEKCIEESMRAWDAYTSQVHQAHGFRHYERPLHSAISRVFRTE